MKIPKNCEVVGAMSTRGNKVVLSLRSPCRHYSSVTLKIDNGEAKVVKTKNRCGMTQISA